MKTRYMKYKEVRYSNKDEYGLGGLIQGIAPLAGMIPGVGGLFKLGAAAVGAIGGIAQGIQDKNEAELAAEAARKKGVQNTSNINQMSMTAQDQYQDTFRAAYGGQVPGANVELEKQETFLTPDGQAGQVDGESHEQGGVDMNLPVDTFVWSDKLKTKNGITYAEATAPLLKQRAKYLKILNA
jgi:hypothetical protein